VKAYRSLFVVVIFALCFVLGCNHSPSTPATSTDNSSSANGGNSAGGGSGNAGNGAQGSSASREAKERPVREAITIPAGTVITVRLGETLSSKTSNAGDGFAATVAQPVSVDGRTVIAQGAAARGSVVDAKSMGHFKGGALLEVKLDSVTIDGKEIPVQTGMIARQAAGKGKRSAGFIGGGAGAGAGTAGAAFTGNKEITLSSESALSFKLKQAVEVK
jgi:hypothetical protein